MNLKVMPRLYKGHRYILCIIGEVSNFLVTVPIFSSKIRRGRRNTLRTCHNKYCIPEYIIMDQDSAFMSSLMTYLFHRLDIKIKTIAPYNHQSLQVEQGIKFLTHILTKHLTGLGPMWTKYVSLAMFAYNIFNSPNPWKL